jgi:hypothetical protein
MDKEFAPYEQALALKELGFNEPCLGAFIGKELKIFSFSNDLKGYTNDANLIIGAATYQQAFRWFREKHKLYHTINMFGDWDKPQYSYLVSGRTMNNPAHMWHFEDKDSHEEAELACLIKLIEIVKSQK